MDLIHVVAAIHERFDQPRYKMYQLLETILTKASNQGYLEEDEKAACW